MSVVYPLGRGSRSNNEEIKYSIRSLFKHSTEGVGTIFIVGEKPKFFEYGDQIVHIPLPENQAKEINIWEKVLAASKDARVSDEFFFTNDDYFFLQDFQMSDFPHFHKGDLRTFDWSNKPINNIRNSYDRKSKMTLDVLTKCGLSTYHFDIHTPNRVEKDKFIQAYEFFKPYLYNGTGLIISTCYGNFNKLEPTQREDYKVRGSELTDLAKNYKDHLLFSIYDDAQIDQLWDFMNTVYPDKSPVEK